MADKAYKSLDYRKVLYCMERILQHSTDSTHYKSLRAESLALLGRYQEAQEVAK